MPSAAACFLPSILSSVTDSSPRSFQGIENGIFFRGQVNHLISTHWNMIFQLWFGSLSYPICFAAFGWIWAQSIAPYTSEFTPLLPSEVTSANTSDSVPLATMHAHHDTVSTTSDRSQAVPSPLYTFLFPFIQVQVNLGFSWRRRIFIWHFLHLVVVLCIYIREGVSCRLKQWYVYHLLWSGLDRML